MAACWSSPHFRRSSTRLGVHLTHCLTRWQHPESSSSRILSTLSRLVSRRHRLLPPLKSLVCRPLLRRYDSLHARDDVLEGVARGCRRTNKAAQRAGRQRNEYMVLSGPPCGRHVALEQGKPSCSEDQPKPQAAHGPSHDVDSYTGRFLQRFLGRSVIPIGARARRHG